MSCTMDPARREELAIALNAAQDLAHDASTDRVAEKLASARAIITACIAEDGLAIPTLCQAVADLAMGCEILHRRRGGTLSFHWAAQGIAAALNSETEGGGQ